MQGKEIFIHVGMPKTGTSYLQKYIFHNFSGAQYLDISNEYYSHIFRDIFFKNMLVYDKAILRKEISDMLSQISANKILISDEGWFGSTIGGSHFNLSNNYYLTQLLHETFPEAKIILTIHRQDKWLESMYRHLLREGYYLGIKSFLNFRKGTFGNFQSAFRIGPNIDFKVVTYLPYIQNYRQCFGGKNVLIMPQELLQKNEDQFIQQLSNFLNTSYVKIQKGTIASVNSSYLYLGSIIARNVNRLFKVKGRGGGLLPVFNYKYLNYKWYIRKIDKLIPIQKHLINKKMRKIIMDYHAKGNKELDSKYNLNLKEYNYYE
ncbi:MAG: hypothetical protein K9N35_01450 [Candidatus Marinimicrobia bacterium]|nr:hypothetical protein [Candidatus Neomarinimicrobiota bacterium]